MVTEPDSPRDLRSGSKSPTPHSILNDVQRALSYASEETCLEFQDIDPQVAEGTSQCLDRAVENRTCRHVNRYTSARGVNLTRNEPVRFNYDSWHTSLRVLLLSIQVHDADCDWLHSQIVRIVEDRWLAADESGRLRTVVGSRKYIGLWDPNLRVVLMFRVRIYSFYRTLRRIKEGTRLFYCSIRATVQLVFILKWTKNAEHQVSGDVKVYDRGPTGSVRLLQSEVSVECAYKPVHILAIS
jgi:hypothetical protein